MKRLFGIAASAVAVLALTGQARERAPIAQGGSSETGLSITGIQGGGVPPSTVESFEWGAMTPMTSSASGSMPSGRAQFANLRVTIPFDASAPLLAAAVANNKSFSDASLSVGSTGSIKLTGVRIVSVKWIGASTGTTVQVELNYGRIEWNMGKTSTMFDTRSNK